MNSVIRWSKGDEIRLGKAVAEFNRKITRLQQNEKNADFLPQKEDYRNLRNEFIKTRKGLNYTINQLKKFKEAGQEEITKYGDTNITKWQSEQIKGQVRQAKAKITRQLTKLDDPTIRSVILGYQWEALRLLP